MSGVVAGSVVSGIFESASYLIHHLQSGAYKDIGYPVLSARSSPTYVAGSIYSPVQMSPLPYVRAHSDQTSLLRHSARVYRARIRPVLISETSGCQSFRPKPEPATSMGVEDPSLWSR